MRRLRHPALPVQVSTRRPGIGTALVLAAGLTGMAGSASAQEIDAARERADCARIAEYAAQGDGFYRKGQYAQARKQYEKQVMWSESCGLPAERVALAYNNVALTYAHQGQYLKAAAWLGIVPRDARSAYNAARYRERIAAAEARSAQSVGGTYWTYSGRAMWNRITVAPVGKAYRIAFDGTYHGMMSMYYGPNLGEFSTVQPIRDGHAHYAMNPQTEGNCSFDFTFADNRVRVERSRGAPGDCGFGMNVSAAGSYYKVAD